MSAIAQAECRLLMDRMGIVEFEILLNLVFSVWLKIGRGCRPAYLLLVEV